MAGDNWFKIGVLGFLLAMTLMMVMTTLDDVKKPDFVSVDSIKKMSCDELHANFQDCRLNSNVETWGYCVQVYLPLYYENCR